MEYDSLIGGFYVIQKLMMVRPLIPLSLMVRPLIPYPLSTTYPLIRLLQLLIGKQLVQKKLHVFDGRVVYRHIGSVTP